jgi:aspartyl protease family protein
MTRRPAPALLILAGLLCGAGTCSAALVSVAGLFPGKVLLSVDGGAPRSLAAGQKSPEGVTIVAVGADTVTLEYAGKRRALRMGESFSTTGMAAPAAAPAAPGGDIVLAADSRGHYMTVGAINDRAVRFMVDTGASVVWISAEVASRVGIDYRSGQPILVNTAGGTRNAFAVRLPSVRVGSVTLTDVDGAVGEGAGTGEMGLLGMSFLSRLSMTRDGNQLRLSHKEAARGAADTRPQFVLTEKRSGLYTAEVKVNGVSLPFLVDTGATQVAIDIAMARRIGLNFEKGTPAMSHTANGMVRSWRIKLDSVSLGPIAQYNVDATVVDGPGIGPGLLGMTFLSRLEMKREGETMVLIKRF